MQFHDRIPGKARRSEAIYYNMLTMSINCKNNSTNIIDTCVDSI